MKATVLYLGETQGILSFTPGTAAARAPLLCLVDHPSETWLPLTTPPLWGRNLRLLIARRLQQNFPDTPYRTALPQKGRLLQPPRDWLLVAVTESEWLERLLAPLTAENRVIRGLWTVSQVAGAWLERYLGGNGPHLAVFRTPEGVRILFFHRQVLLSRLLTPELVAAGLDQELERTVRYLYNQKLVPRDEPLATSFFGIAPPDRSSPVWVPFPPRGEWQRRFAQWLDEGLVGLIPWWQRQWRFPPSLAPESLLTPYRFQQTRVVLLAGGALLPLALLGYTAMVTWEGWTLRQSHETALALQGQLQAELARHSAAISSFGVPAERLLATIDAHQILFEQSGTLPALLSPLTAAFAATPEYHLTELTITRPDLGQVPSSSPPPPAAPSPTTAFAGAAACPPNPLPSDQPYRLLIAAEGSVTGDLPLRQLLDAERRFLAPLSREGWHILAFAPPVTPEKQPVSGENGRLQLEGFRLCLEWSAAR